jgi:SSS family transporter
MGPMSSLGWLDWVVCGGYFAVVLALGLWFARGQRTQEQYFVGGRRMPWFAVGLSLFATTFSALSFVGLPREAAYDNYHLYLAILFIPLWAAPVIGWLFVPLYHRLGLTSAYEYLERRFSRPLRLAGSLLYSLYALGWMGSILYAVGVILQALLGLNEQQLVGTMIALGLFITVITAVGGIEASVWSDVVRSAVLVGSMTTVLVLTLSRIDGGWGTVWRLGLAHGKFQMFDFHFDPTVRNTFWSACAFGMFVYLAAHATAQPSVQRYQATPTISTARWSLAVRGVAIAVGCLLFFVVGSTLFAFYHQALPPSAKAGSGFPNLARQDHLLPYFVLHELSIPGLAGLLLAGLFAATMSTVESGINSLAALVACDWLSAGEREVRKSRWMSVLLGLGVIGTSLLVPYLGTNVFDIIIKISGAFFGPLLGVFLLGMFVPRANASGAVAGLAGGVATLVVVVLTPISPWWYGALTCVPTVAVGTLASFLFSPPPARQVLGLVVVPWNRLVPPPGASGCTSFGPGRPSASEPPAPGSCLPSHGHEPA